MNLVYIDSTCIIGFKSYEETSCEIEKCGPLKRFCKGTGIWKNYDMDIEIACNAYSSVINVLPTLYQNIFCEVCDISDSGVPIRMCIEVRTSLPYSFSGLLRVEELQKVSSTKACLRRSVFDRQKVVK